MRNRFAWLALLALVAAGTAGAAGEKGDPFRGKLFPPNVILEHREALELTKAQFTAIREAVVRVQADIAEHEWDLQEAYQEIMQSLDQKPIDEQKTLGHVSRALAAENEVKKKQMTMLIRIRNLLTDEQVAYLEQLGAVQ